MRQRLYTPLFPFPFSAVTEVNNFVTASTTKAALVRTTMMIMNVIIGVEKVAIDGAIFVFVCPANVRSMCVNILPLLLSCFRSCYRVCDEMSGNASCWQNFLCVSGILFVCARPCVFTAGICNESELFICFGVSQVAHTRSLSTETKTRAALFKVLEWFGSGL